MSEPVKGRGAIPPLISPDANLTVASPSEGASINRNVLIPPPSDAIDALKDVLPVPVSKARGAGKTIKAFFRKLSGPFLVFVRFPIARRGVVSVSARIVRLYIARMLNRSFIFTLLPPVRMHARFDFGSPILAYYLGLYEESSMTFLLRYLRRDECFADVGANVGVYTLLAAGVAGARVHAFEPFSVAYDALTGNVSLNALGERAALHRQGVGSDASTAFITTTNKGANRIAGAVAGEAMERIDVVTLDDALDADVPAVIKIDVEGYEEQVLLGARRILSSKKVNIVILEAIERNPGSGHVDRCVSILTEFGFRQCTYDPEANRLTECEDGVREFVGPNDENYLFVKDIEKARRRIRKEGRRCGLHR